MNLQQETLLPAGSFSWHLYCKRVNVVMLKCFVSQLDMEIPILKLCLCAHRTRKIMALILHRNKVKTAKKKRYVYFFHIQQCIIVT